MTEERRDGIGSKSRHEKKVVVQFCDASQGKPRMKIVAT